MKIYFGIKYYEDFSNRKKIEEILKTIETKGHETYCVVRDMEEWGDREYQPDQLMKKTFEQIDKADILLIEFSEKGTGLGIEAGYGYAKSKQIIIIAKEGAEISKTLKGISTKIITYRDIKELEPKLHKVIEQQIENMF